MRSGRARLVVILCLVGVAIGTGGMADVHSLTGVDQMAELGPSVGGPADGIYDGETARDGAQSRQIQLTQRFAQLDRQGWFRVTHEYTFPGELRELEVSVPEEATVLDRSGFTHKSNATFEWTGESATARLTYRMPANQTAGDGRTSDQTGNDTGSTAQDSQYEFVDTGGWGIVEQPTPQHWWKWSGGGHVGLNRSVRVETPGAAGEQMVYFGEYDEYTRIAHGQRFRLIVPKQASLAVERSSLFDSLTAASDALRVGSRDDEVTMIAAPNGTVDWAIRGLQRGPADFWVRDDERLDTPDNVWLHEYVHTRQDYEETSGLEWFHEGSAVYYAALLSLEQDRISFDQFTEQLAVGTHPRFGDSILADPQSWQRGSNYATGALVSGALDRRLRSTTNGTASLQSVLRRLNSREGRISAESFQETVATVGSESLAADSERFMQTTERPELWEKRHHESVFDR